MNPVKLAQSVVSHSRSGHNDSVHVGLCIGLDEKGTPIITDLYGYVQDMSVYKYYIPTTLRVFRPNLDPVLFEKAREDLLDFASEEERNSWNNAKKCGIAFSKMSPYDINKFNQSQYILTEFGFYYCNTLKKSINKIRTDMEGCRLLKIFIDPEQYPLPEFWSENTILLFNNQLFYAAQERREIYKIEITKSNQSSNGFFEQLKTKVTNTESFIMADEYELELIKSLIDFTKLDKLHAIFSKEESIHQLSDEQLVEIASITNHSHQKVMEKYQFYIPGGTESKWNQSVSHLLKIAISPSNFFSPSNKKLTRTAEEVVCSQLAIQTYKIVLLQMARYLKVTDEHAFIENYMNLHDNTTPKTLEGYLIDNVNYSQYIIPTEPNIFDRLSEKIKRENNNILNVFFDGLVNQLLEKGYDQYTKALIFEENKGIIDKNFGYEAKRLISGSILLEISYKLLQQASPSTFPWVNEQALKLMNTIITEPSEHVATKVMR